MPADRFQLLLVDLNLPVKIDETVVAIGKHTSRQRAEIRSGILEYLRQALAQVTQAAGDDQPVFAQQPPGLIGHCRALFDQVLTDAVQHLDVLLFRAFQRHKVHARPADGFTDGLGIVRIILVALHIRLDELRRDQAHLMPLLDQLASPIVGAGTGFDTDEGRRQVGKESQHLASLQLLAQYRLAGPIDAMHLKPLLCDIQTDCRSIHLGFLLSHEVVLQMSALAQHDAVREEESIPLAYGLRTLRKSLVN